ncbi:hypothetical protein WAC35_29170, partial [Klebsiella pneumoniae]|uniref:hypothetical protein n=1 Tax=Klebsiella pneumoniae TaxID=573 RepID=UPI003012DC19
MVPPQQGDEIERDFGPFAQGERSRFWGLLCLWSLRAIYGLIAMFVLFGVASIIAGSLHPNSALSLTLADIMLYARW